jgi:hypothetical protein
MTHIIELSNITELDYNNTPHIQISEVGHNIILIKLDRDIKINNLLLFILNIIMFICGCGLVSLIIIIIIMLLI